jgi:glycerate 2-kinase
MEPRILNTASLINHGNREGRKAMAEILEAGLQASDPYANTLKLFRLQGSKLAVGQREFEPVGDPHSGDAVFDLEKIKNIWVFGAGKGIQRVAKAIEDVLGDRLTGGHIVDKKGHPVICRKIGVTLGAHPVPDIDCVRGCERILTGLQKIAKGDLVFTLAGNGVSALLTMPSPGVTIEDVSRTTYVMQITLGVPTADLNAIRNHIDVLKGGRISRLIHERGAQAVDIISVGNSTYRQLVYQNLWLHPLPDFTTFAMARDTVDRFDAWDKIPESVKKIRKEADPAKESVKGEEFEKWGNRIFGVMPEDVPGFFLRTAMRRAGELGFKPVLLSKFISPVEAVPAGLYTACIAQQIERTGEPFEPPVALFSGGELITTVGNETGIGGRNQEFCLSAARLLTGSKNIIFGSLDTDGTDGPGTQYTKGMEGMPACLGGAIVDGYTMEEAKAAGVNVAEELRHHNTSPALWKINSAMHISPSISIGDLTCLLITGKN